MLEFFIPSAIAAEEAVNASSEPGIEGFLFPVALIAIFYFLLIRPQQKRTKDHKKMVAEAAKGDEIITSGGVLGKITEIGDHFLTLEIANNLSVQLTKSSISSVMPKGTYKAAVKPNPKPKK